MIETVQMNNPVQHRKEYRVRRGVIGILSRGSKFLMIRRAEGIVKGGTWCFPGGHVERGETPRVAVVRELREELGIEITPTVRLGSLRILDSRHILVAWRVERTTGQLTPDPKEVAEVRWLTPQEIRTIRPTLPSNDVVLTMLGV